MIGNTKELKWELTSEGGCPQRTFIHRQHKRNNIKVATIMIFKGTIPLEVVLCLDGREAMTRRSVSHLESRRNEIGHKELQMYDMHSTG